MVKGDYAYRLATHTEAHRWRHVIDIVCCITETCGDRSYAFEFRRCVDLGELRHVDLMRPRVLGARAELVRHDGEAPITRRHRAERLAYSRCRKIAAAQLELAFRWLDEPIAAYLAISGRDDAVSLAM